MLKHARFVGAGLVFVLVLACLSPACAKSSITQKSNMVMVSMISTADANASTGEVSVVTSDNYFARVQVSTGTQITRAGRDFGLPAIRSGLNLTCKGNWDSSSNVFKAAYVFVGKTVSDSEVGDRVAAACQKISKQSSIGLARLGSAEVQAYTRTALARMQFFSRSIDKLNRATLQVFQNDAVLLDNDWVDKFEALALTAKENAVQIASTKPVPAEFRHFQDMVAKSADETQQFADGVLRWVKTRHLDELESSVPHLQQATSLLNQAVSEAPRP